MSADLGTEADRRRVEIACQRALHFTGPRALSDALIALSSRVRGGLPVIADVIEANTRFAYETLTAISGEKFPAQQRRQRRARS